LEQLSIMKWVYFGGLLLLTVLLIWCLPYVFTFGFILMGGNPGGLLICGALIVAYIGFIGPLWRKTWRLCTTLPAGLGKS